MLRLRIPPVKPFEYTSLSFLLSKRRCQDISDQDVSS